MKSFVDIVDRLSDEEKYIDAIDDAIEEILQVRGLLFSIIECFDKGFDGETIEQRIENARAYMRGEQ